MECEKCGALLSRMHNFCPRCGTKVSGENEPLKKKKEKKKKEVRKPTNEEILAHRQQLIKSSIRKIKNLSIYDVCMFLFNFILACMWLRVACGCFLLLVEHGFNERCGWEGNKTVCYMLVWEKMSRLYVPYVAFIQGATSLDCLVQWVRKGTFDVKRALSRCIGRPAILLGIIGFDGMHHLNYIYRDVSPALFVILWSLSEGLHYASEASTVMNIAIVFQCLHRVTKRFLSHFILLVEFLLVLGATIYTRRVFSYPLVRVADTKTWKESEGMGHMPLEVTWGVRILASVYAISVMRDVAFIMKHAVISRSSTKKIKTK